jgi:hypothetical protein
MSYKAILYGGSERIAEIAEGVASSASTAAFLPYATWTLPKTRYQLLIFAQELLDAGFKPGFIFKGLVLHSNSNAPADLLYFTIRIQNTDMETVSGWVTTGWQTVYGPKNIDGSVIKLNSWNAHAFDEEFIWDGSNLLIDFTKDGNPNPGGNSGNRRKNIPGRVASWVGSSGTWPYDDKTPTITSTEFVQMQLFGHMGSGTRKIFVCDTISPHYSRRIAQATEVGFTMAKSDPKADLLGECDFLELYLGEKKLVSAEIERRDLNTRQGQITITGMTNEVNLRKYITPTNWSYDGWEAMDAVRDLLHEFRTVSFQTQSDWLSCARNGVDIYTQPTRNGDVILAKDDDAYLDAGTITTPPIDLGEDLLTIGPIRWKQTVGEFVKIEVRTQTSDGTPGGWSEWSAWQSPAVPEESETTGVPCLSPVARYLKVEIRLTTEDTTTPSETGTTFGFTPILHALEIVTRHPTELSAADDLPVSLEKQIDGVTFDRQNHLAAMIQLCEHIGLEWYVDGDNKLHGAVQLGEDKSNEIALIEGKNANITTLSDAPGDVANIVTAYGAGEGLAQLKVTKVDEASVHRYGRRYATVEFSQIDDLAELEWECDKYLQEHAWPKPELRVDTFLNTDIGLGDIVRVASVSRNLVTTARVLEIQTRGTDIMTLGLNNRLLTVADQIAKKVPPLPIAPLPNKPSNLTAQAGIKMITLYWDPNYADYYVVEYTADGGLTWKLLADKHKENMLLHQNLNVGETFGYRVYAVKEGRKSEYAGPIFATAEGVKDVPVEQTLESGEIIRQGVWGLVVSDPEDPSNIRPYVNRIAMGEASDGDWVELGWGYQPKVLVSERRLKTYDASKSGESQRIEVYADDITPQGFRVHAQCWVEGGTVSKYTPIHTLNEAGQSWVFPYASGPNTRKIVIQGRNFHWMTVDLFHIGETRVYYRIYTSPADEDNWTMRGEYFTQLFHHNQWWNGSVNSKTISWQQTLLLDPGEYKVKVEFNRNWANQYASVGIPPINEVTIAIYTYHRETLVDVGEVSYIAIEGGTQGGV